MTNQAKLTLLSRIRLVCIILAICLFAASATTGWMTYTEEMRAPVSVPDASAPHREGKYDNDTLPSAAPSAAAPTASEEAPRESDPGAANAGVDLFGNPASSGNTKPNRAPTESTPTAEQTPPTSVPWFQPPEKPEPTTVPEESESTQSTDSPEQAPVTSDPTVPSAESDTDSDN